MKRFLPIYFLLLIVIFSACKPDVNTFARKITAKQLRKHLEIIASDSMQGREMATEGESRASKYIAQTFKKSGLLPAPGTNEYLQGFEVQKDSMLAGYLHIGNENYPFQKNVVGFESTDSAIQIHSDAIFFAGYGIDDPKYSDYEGHDVTGKVVAFLFGEPMIDSSHHIISGNEKRSEWSKNSIWLTKKLSAAKKKGAKAALILDIRFDTVPGYILKSNLTGGFQPSTEKAELSNLTVIKPVAQALLNQDYRQITTLYKSKSSLKDHVLAINKTIDFSIRKTTLHKTVNNVIGFIEGTDKKNEYVVVSAHYDHLGTHDGEIYHGADDNGSGTCGLMSMAKAFSEAAEDGLRPRRSIVFLSVTGEEKGLFGSKNYVAHPSFPLSQTVVDVNTDMIGRIDSEHEKDSIYIYVIGDDKLSSELRGINERNNTEHTKLALDYRYNDPDDPNRFYYRSDHYEFAQKNIPIIFYFDGVHKDYHRPSDTVDKINFELMEARARLAFYTVWEIANRENRLKVDKHGE